MCPECDFHAAHVKIKEEEGKQPYRHCPECGAQYFARSQRQGDLLRAKIRAEQQPEPAAQPAAVEPTPPAAAPAPKPAATHKMILGVMVPA